MLRRLQVELFKKIRRGGRATDVEDVRSKSEAKRLRALAEDISQELDDLEGDIDEALEVRYR